MNDYKEDFVPPVPMAFLLCDQVIEDGQTGKKTLVGVFNKILATTFPAQHKPCALYFRGADCQGKLDILVKYVDCDTQNVLAEATANMDAVERGDVEFIMVLPPIPIPKPGQYEFQLYMNGRYMQRLRFVAERLLQEEEE